MANVREMKLAKLKKLLSAPGFPLELELHRLDCMSSHKMMECWLYMVDKINEIPRDQLAPEPFVTGKDLISLGGRPGPHFKKILDTLYDAQLAGKYPSSAEALGDAEKMLEKMR
jgi:poly(A) polymerase